MDNLRIVLDSFAKNVHGVFEPDVPVVPVVPNVPVVTPVLDGPTPSEKRLANSFNLTVKRSYIATITEYMARYFHGTSVQNIPGIEKEGLKPIWDYVYLTDSMQSAINWMGFRLTAGGQHKMAIIEVEMDGRKLRPGNDHHPIFQQIFGAGKSLISPKVIPPSSIVKIHYINLK